VRYLKLASDVALLNFSTLNPLQSPTAFVTATPSPALLAAVPAAVSEALSAAAAAATATATATVSTATTAAPAVTVSALLQHLAALRREVRHRCEHVGADVSARPLTRTADALQTALCEHLPGYALATAVPATAAAGTSTGSGGATAIAQLVSAEGAAVGTLYVFMPEGATAGESTVCMRYH
jgi:hypothetical protein